MSFCWLGRILAPMSPIINDEELRFIDYVETELI